MKILIKLGVTGVALWVAVWLVPGLDFEGSFWGFVGVSALVLVANAVVKPILNVFSIPFIIVSLGLFLLITNALVLQLVMWLSEPERLDLGLTSTGFWWATFLGALIISIVRAIVGKALEED